MGGGSTSETSDAGRRIPVRWLLTVVVASRIFVTALVQFSREHFGILSDATAAPMARWLQPWTIFDSGLYLQIAQRGYASTTSAFFSLYPKLISVVNAMRANTRGAVAASVAPIAGFVGVMVAAHVQF
jgi:hypothetical protein